MLVVLPFFIALAVGLGMGGLCLGGMVLAERWAARPVRTPYVCRCRGRGRMVVPQGTGVRRRTASARQ